MTVTLKPTPYDHDDEIQILDEPSATHWSEWRDLCESEGWVVIDHSVATLMPRLSTTRAVVAVRKSDNVLVGAMVWNEFPAERLAYVPTYVLRAECRGKGVGSAIWTRAMQRIDKHHYTIALTSVLEMLDKYVSTDMPVKEMEKFPLYIPVDKMIDALSDHAPRTDNTTKLVSQLTSEEMEKVLEFDYFVCGRDRSELMREHWKLDCTEGSVLLSPSSSVLAMAGVCPTGPVDKRLYRLAPLFAPDLAAAAAVLLPLIRSIHNKHPTATIILHVFKGSQGEAVLAPVLAPLSTRPPVVIAQRAFSRPFVPPASANLHMLLVAHNHSVYIDV